MEFFEEVNIGVFNSLVAMFFGAGQHDSGRSYSLTPYGELMGTAL